MSSNDSSVDDHTPENERMVREAALDQTIENSFPASDPPSTNPNPYDQDALAEAEPARERGDRVTVVHRARRAGAGASRGRP